MPRLLSEPKEKTVQCNSDQGCGATIAYLPEEVEFGKRSDMGRDWTHWKRVKCPREGCLGYGYIKGRP